jgi:hypothetical protein
MLTTTGSKGTRNAPKRLYQKKLGAVAQLGEHLLCKQGVAGSIPVRSTPINRRPAPAYVGATPNRSGHVSLRLVPAVRTSPSHPSLPTSSPRQAPCSKGAG